MSRRTQAQIVAIMVAVGLAIPANAADQPAADASPSNPPAAPKRLDLSIPDITTLYTQEQIAVFLAKTRTENMDEVEVQAHRGPRRSVTPDVWGGIAAPFWAVLNPTQAWRVFAPLPPDQVRRLQHHEPDATAPYRASAARSARDL